MKECRKLLDSYHRGCLAGTRIQEELDAIETSNFRTLNPNHKIYKTIFSEKHRQNLDQIELGIELNLDDLIVARRNIEKWAMPLRMH